MGRSVYPNLIWDERNPPLKRTRYKFNIYGKRAGIVLILLQPFIYRFVLYLY